MSKYGNYICLAEFPPLYIKDFVNLLCLSLIPVTFGGNIIL